MPSNKRESRAEFRQRLNRTAQRPPRHLAQASRRPPDMFHRPYMYRRYQFRRLTFDTLCGWPRSVRRSATTSPAPGGCCSMAVGTH